jgi:hypothetical protein
MLCASLFGQSPFSCSFHFIRLALRPYFPDESGDTIPALGTRSRIEKNKLSRSFCVKSARANRPLSYRSRAGHDVRTPCGQRSKVSAYVSLTRTSRVLGTKRKSCARQSTSGSAIAARRPRNPIVRQVSHTPRCGIYRSGAREIAIKKARLPHAARRRGSRVAARGRAQQSAMPVTGGRTGPVTSARR